MVVTPSSVTLQPVLKHDITAASQAVVEYSTGRSVEGPSLLGQSQELTASDYTPSEGSATLTDYISTTCPALENPELHSENSAENWGNPKKSLFQSTVPRATS